MKYLTVKKKKTFDIVAIGLVGGLLVPCLAIITFYFVQYYPFTDFSYFINGLFSLTVFSKIISLCAIPNLLLFFVFLWTNRNQSAKGVIVATLLLVVLVIILKSL